MSKVSVRQHKETLGTSKKFCLGKDLNLSSDSGECWWFPIDYITGTSLFNGFLTSCGCGYRTYVCHARYPVCLLSVHVHVWILMTSVFGLL